MDGDLNSQTDNVGSASALGDRIWVDRDSFLSDEAGDGRCPAEIDITGRPRRLAHALYGPLAAGSWRVTFELELREDAGRRSMNLEVRAGDDVTTRSVPMGREGRLRLQVDHTLAESSILDCSLQLTKPAFHGCVKLLGAWLEPISAHG
jgi:hypothetical protein